MRAGILATLSLIAGLAVPAAAQSTQPLSPDARFELQKAVTDAIDHYAYYSVFDAVEVHLDGRAVTLTGKVTSPFKLRGIERKVEGVDGVTVIRNELEVLPVSQLDDRLRLTLVSAIYGNPHFRHYGAVQPPIRILVERGHVRVEGVVMNDTDRALARAIVRTVPAYSIDVDLKTTAEARAALEQI
jgi:hypothetical protein